MHRINSRRNDLFGLFQNSRCLSTHVFIDRTDARQGSRRRCVNGFFYDGGFGEAGSRDSCRSLIQNRRLWNRLKRYRFSRFFKDRGRRERRPLFCYRFKFFGESFSGVGWGYWIRCGASKGATHATNKPTSKATNSNGISNILHPLCQLDVFRGSARSLGVFTRRLLNDLLRTFGKRLYSEALLAELEHPLGN